MNSILLLLFSRITSRSFTVHSRFSRGKCISAEGNLAFKMTLAQGHEMRQKSNGTCKADGQTLPQIQSWTHSWVLSRCYNMYPTPLFKRTPLIGRNWHPRNTKLHSHPPEKAKKISTASPDDHIQTHKISKATDSVIRSTRHAHHQKQANQTKTAKFNQFLPQVQDSFRHTSDVWAQDRYTWVLTSPWCLLGC